MASAAAAARAEQFPRTGLLDFREWLDELERIGQLVRIKDEIDPMEEAGAIMRLANERKGPAQWFANVKGAMPGSSLVGGPYATKERVAVAFGLPPETSDSVLADVLARGLRSERIKPEIVAEGSCQENVMIGDEVDLLRLPVPKLHPQDGGRYIGTLNTGVCRDYDSDWVNWGTYRGMVHDQRSTGLWLGPLNHGGQILRKWHANGKTMEYAMFFGGDPMHLIVSSCGVPWGVSEVEVVGGIRSEPVKLVKCKTVDLCVPANAEIVLEGTITPGDLKEEGPFGEYPGYVVSGSNPRPVFRVSAVTYRNNPILPATCLGVPLDDSKVWELEISGSVKEALLAKGVPVRDVAVPEFSAAHAIVVSTQTPRVGIPQFVASVVWTDRNGSYVPYCIVVDDDVDPWNLGEVFHALCTKCNPVRDIHVYPGMQQSPLAPYVSGNPLREFGGGGGNVLLDCTWPVEWKPQERPHRLAFSNTYSEAVRKKVLENFARWGLERKS